MTVFVPAGEDGEIYLRYYDVLQEQYPLLADRLSAQEGEEYRTVDDILYLVDPEHPEQLHAIRVPTGAENATLYNASSLYCVSLEDGSFRDCKALTSLVIPNRVESIGDRVFENCASLKTLTIEGETLQSIGEGALRSCSSLKTLTLPESVRSLGDGMLPVQTTLCGEVEIRTREIYCYDVLHLFCVKKAYRTEKKMSIYPALLPVSLVLRQRPKSKETGDIYDEDLRGNDTSEIFDIRDYQEGDSLRAVHWKLSFKMNRLLLREFSRPASFDTILLFSLSGKDRVPDKRISRVASLVLSLDHALLELEMEHQVGCMIHGRLLEMPVRSRSGGMQLRDSIMGMHAEGEPSDVIRSFMKQGRQFAYTKVIYVTAEPEGALLKNLAEQVNLSVFVPTEGEKDSIDNSGGYELIALSEKEPAAGRYIYI